MHRISAMGTSAAAGLVLIAMLGGCAHQTGEQVVTQARAILAERTASASSLDQLARKPLPLKPAVFTLGEEQAEVFNVDGENSYVTVLELPPFQRAYSVTLMSTPLGSTLDTWLFVPRVTVLDEHFKATRSFTEEGMRSRGSSLERTVFFNPANARDRYLLIHSGALKSAYQREVQVVTTQQMSNGLGGFMNWTDGRDAKGMVRASPTGKVEVTVDGLTPPDR